MARPRKIWPRKGSDYFYTKIDGKQTRLEKTEKASHRKLEKILRNLESGPAGPDPAVGSICDLFLDDSKEKNEPCTFELHKLVLQSFCDSVGKTKKVSAIREHHVDTWLKAKATWGDSTRVRAKAILLAALNFAVRKGHVNSHPLKNVKPGTVRRREKILSAEEKEKIKGAVSGPMADFLVALELTGARPFSEVCRVTAKDVDLEKGTWTLTKWKNSKKQKGRKRVIYLPPALFALTKRLMEKHPEGPLFRGRNGKPYLKQTVTWRMRDLAEKLGIEEMTAYAWRHSYITECLAKGMSASIVAELVGSSVATINKYYDHLDQKGDILREAALKAVT